ncbi:hypothetical protein DH2020_028319 [Rehmannia glutinosa]|uniref:Serine/threonine protein phosphatase 2A regulatory subunit n=1 Tax=Rehmannia glutinosa TaxID=99300 RepID=A0ABR0VRP0_REHGL
MKSAREKEIKRQTLTELVDLNTGSEGGDPEEDEMYMDPTWPHLQLVYELLLRYVVSSDMETKIAKKYLDHSFVLKLLDLFDSEDLREREYVKTILHRIYGKFMVHRPFIRNAINNIFYRFIFETERYSGVGELLEILGSIINGFALPMKEEHKLFLVRALIPLHKPKCIASYHQQLAYCITQFVEKDYRLADTVIRGVLKYWPVTNCGKEVLFLGELEEILEVTQSAEFQRCMVPLFRQIDEASTAHIFSLFLLLKLSPAFSIMDMEPVLYSIFLSYLSVFQWLDDSLECVLAFTLFRLCKLTLTPTPIIIIREKNIRGHWNQAINGLSSNVRRMFLEMDTELFEECQRQYEEREARAGELEELRVSNWKRLEEVAAQVTYGDNMVLV